MPKVPKITSLQHLLNIFTTYLKENMKDKVDFLPTDKHERFLQISTDHCSCVWLGMSKLPKIARLLFFAYNLMKEVSDEVDFLHADKHESLLQIDTMILMGMVKHSQSSQNGKFAMSFTMSKMKLIFCMYINIKVSYKLISILRASKFPTG